MVYIRVEGDNDGKTMGVNDVCSRSRSREPVTKLGERKRGFSMRSRGGGDSRKVHHTETQKFETGPNNHSDFQKVRGKSGVSQEPLTM